MDEFGLVWLSSVWFEEVDLLKCSRSASQLSFTNLLTCKVYTSIGAGFLQIDRIDMIFPHLGTKVGCPVK